jgi:hypothetical protein
MLEGLRDPDPESMPEGVLPHAMAQRHDRHSPDVSLIHYTPALGAARARAARTIATLLMAVDF